MRASERQRPAEYFCGSHHRGISKTENIGDRTDTPIVRPPRVRIGRHSNFNRLWVCRRRHNRKSGTTVAIGHAGKEPLPSSPRHTPYRFCQLRDSHTQGTRNHLMRHATPQRYGCTDSLIIAETVVGRYLFHGTCHADSLNAWQTAERIPSDAEHFGDHISAMTLVLQMSNPLRFGCGKNVRAFA